MDRRLGCRDLKRATYTFLDEMDFGIVVKDLAIWRDMYIYILCMSSGFRNDEEE